MKKQQYVVFMLIGLLFMCMNFGQRVFADDMSFSVTAKPSENQRDKTKTYFDLRVTPGTTENLGVELQNNTDKEVTVLVGANTAVTNSNGVIDYSKEDPELNPTLKYPFGDLVTADKEIVLKGKEKKLVDIPVAIPKDPFDGIILGGLHFSQKESKEDEEQASGVQVKNKFAYVIGVRLSENDEEVPVALNLLGVKAGQRNYRNTVLATLENPEPRILSDMEIESYIYAEKDTNNALYYSKNDKLSMAPNSSFDYGISLNNQAFKPGKYVLKMTVKVAGETFEFEESFEIKSDEAKKLNDDAVELAKPDDGWKKYLVPVLLVLLAVIIVLLVLLLKNKRKQKE